MMSRWSVPTALTYLSRKTDCNGMFRRRHLAVVLLLSIAISFSSAATAADEGRHIQVGDRDTVTASVSNPLQVPDILRVEFNGDAVSKGMVGVELPEDGSRLRCIHAENTCEVSLEPGGERDVEFSITGMHAGTEDFLVSVSSDITGKRSEASVQITVERQEGGGFMDLLNRLLGIV